MTSPTIITIDLPLPPKLLHPNSRTASWKLKAHVTKKRRGLAKLLAMEQRPDQPLEKATILATFHMPRRQDPDNLIAWLKSTIDGLKDGGVIKDDGGLTWLPPVQITGKKANGKRVVLHLAAGG